MSTEVIAVITGDVVDSRTYRDHDYDSMLELLQVVLGEVKRTTLGSFDVFRGDSFQFVTSNIKEVITAALIIRLTMLIHSPSVEVRQSIGIGALTSRRENVKLSTGDAFILSGKGLESMKGELLAIHTLNETFQNNIVLLTRFLDVHLSKLKYAQAQALLAHIQHPKLTHKQLAKELAKSRVNTTQLLTASDYKLVDAYIHFFKSNLPKSKDLL
ncbi:hypothetical protein A28LD_1608 [Idiomarina sp. A28L]|uniref:hypothetical protein n=1 Tax=Idiomarina sp. A28L TaxID=1036674 RepID=UPI0002138C3E|nr:hypothetical protein [Idiomarina sp. A28L]EGN74595.1 hypothetical protein A28LD_1608 [Idiomarina sp. A28L]